MSQNSLPNKLNRQKRLASYSTIANLALAGGLALATPVHAAEVVINLTPDVVLNSNGESVNIDFDQDGTPEFDIRLDITSYNRVILDHFAAGPPDHGTAAIGYIGSGFPFVSALPTGTTVDNGDVFITNFDPSLGYNASYGAFPGNGPQIVGVRFQLDGVGPYYGWILAEVNSDSSQATVYGYGYNDTQGAGSTSPSPTAISLATAGAESVESTATPWAVGGFTLLAGLSLWWRQKVVARLKRTEA